MLLKWQKNIYVVIFNSYVISVTISDAISETFIDDIISKEKDYLKPSIHIKISNMKQYLDLML